MQWEKPSYSRKQIRRAGDLIAKDVDEPVRFAADFANAKVVFRHLQAQLIFNNWRAAHAYPLNTFQITLKARAARVDPEALTAQRLKRSPSIVAKLRRFEKMDLARMQDIGGCRAIVCDIPAVYALMQAFETGRARHILEGYDDYIAEPKEDGYRGVHLIYKYVGRGNGAVYNGLRIEVQLRTQIQHAWATAVETVGLFRREAIKSGEGNEQWREFFRVASDGFSILEHDDPAPTEAKAKIRDTLSDLASHLDVFSRLHHYSEALRLVEQSGDASQYLLELDLANDQLTVRGFGKQQRGKAQQEYAIAEQRLASTGDVVLVSVENVIALRKAFPNYFADTSLFIATLERVLNWDSTASRNWLKEWVDRLN